MVASMKNDDLMHYQLELVLIPHKVGREITADYFRDRDPRALQYLPRLLPPAKKKG
jgi:hypothetical protein